MDAQYFTAFVVLVIKTCDLVLYVSQISLITNDPYHVPACRNVKFNRYICVPSSKLGVKVTMILTADCRRQWIKQISYDS